MSPSGGRHRVAALALVHRVDTPVGQGVDLSSTLSLPGGEASSRILELDSPGGTISFVLGSTDTETAQAFVDSLVRTIHRT